MKKSTTLLFFSILMATLQSGRTQNITTYAGLGTASYSGDGGQATAAELNGPFGVCSDAAGNLIVADRNNERIRMVNAISGLITTIAGNGVAGYKGDGGPATAAELFWPENIGLDLTGNIYISDHKNNVVRKINTSGIISTIAGNGYQGYNGDGGAATAAELFSPIGLACDAIGNVFITDAGNNCVREVNSTGTITTIAGNGVVGYWGDGGPATAAELNWTADVVIDGSGNLLISDFYNNCIRKVNTSGMISTFAGNTITGYSGDGGAATAAELNWPNGLAMDGTGNLFIADEVNNCVRQINTVGIISTVAGNFSYGAGFSGDGGPATSAEMNVPAALTVNPAGTDLFIADFNNNRIRRVIISTEGINTPPSDISDLIVYPNPAKDVINLQMQGNKGIENVILYSITGQKISENKTKGKQNMQISTSGLSAGVYFLSVLTPDGMSIVKKINIIR